MEQTHECILCIVNAGFSDTVMDAAREVGARGGTVINAHGTASKDAETFFNIAIQDEKEIVMILVTPEQKHEVLKAVHDACGLHTPGQGIAFSLPVDAAVGLNNK